MRPAMGTRLTALLLAGALTLALSACAPAGEVLPPETTPTPAQTARPEPVKVRLQGRPPGALDFFTWTQELCIVPLRYICFGIMWKRIRQRESRSFWRI